MPTSKSMTYHCHQVTLCHSKALQPSEFDQCNFAFAISDSVGCEDSWIIRSLGSIAVGLPRMRLPVNIRGLGSFWHPSLRLDSLGPQQPLIDSLHYCDRTESESRLRLPVVEALRIQDG
jgi:hypothetical protein